MNNHELPCVLLPNKRQSHLTEIGWRKLRILEIRKIREIRDSRISGIKIRKIRDSRNSENSENSENSWFVVLATNARNTT